MSDPVVTDYSVPPLAIVNLITRDLQDRYKYGFPILKELLQNAEDRKSRRVLIDLYRGWPNARNPLFKGPGLLVANDGEFKEADKDGIPSILFSPKATDSATIGKFGLGQKAVFHLCDAFVIHVVNATPWTKVLNPWLRIDGNKTDSWGQYVEDHTKLLVKQAGQDYKSRAVILWLPFRRQDLMPTPNAGFSTKQPTAKGVVDHFARTDRLRLILTALRHLRSIEIRHEDKIHSMVSIGDRSGRLHGPPCTRSFSGTVAVGQEDYSHALTAAPASSAFVGREATTHDDELAELQSSDHWPKTVSAVQKKPEREIGEPHGAATLLRTDSTSNELTISWAVFLPISEDIPRYRTLPVDASVGRVHLLLHGYFFLDGGRTDIQGIDKQRQTQGDGPSELQRAWNTQLRDTAVLPLIPSLLKDAFKRRVVEAHNFEHVVRALARSCWFEDHRRAICRDYSLVRVLDTVSKDGRSRRGVSWCLVPTGTKLRMLPARLASEPKQVDELFGRIALDDVKLCIDVSASLTDQDAQWTLDELNALFSELSPRAFQSSPLAVHLKELLSELPCQHCSAIAHHLVTSFRQAMMSKENLVGTDYTREILKYVPPGLLFTLPKSAASRDVLCTLASSKAKILPVRFDDSPDHHNAETDISMDDLCLLLGALEPLISDRRSDHAATAALALLARHDIRKVGSDRRFQNIRVFRARKPQDGSVHRVLSFAELIKESDGKLLFRPGPRVDENLRKIVRALPSVQPLIVDAARDYCMLRSRDLTITADQQGLSHLVNSAHCFGGVIERCELVRELVRLGAKDKCALRKLCAGHFSAGNATLWNEGSLPQGLEQFANEIIDLRTNEFLVPSAIVRAVADVLPEIKNVQIVALTERSIDFVDDLVEQRPGVVSELLRADILPDRLLISLPIHEQRRGDDTRVAIADDCFVEGEWGIPEKLRGLVWTVSIDEDEVAARRQRRLFRCWSPLEQVRVAVSQENCHAYWSDIVGGLCKLAEADSLTGRRAGACV